MSNEKFKENEPDPQMNISELDAIFDVAIDKRSIDKQVQEVDEMRKEIQVLSDDLPDADQLIIDNIDRANRILDKIEDNLDRGELSARLFEVTGQLINAVTAAATSITGISYNQQSIDIKTRALDIKEAENEVKSLVKGAKEVNITNNNLTMSREKILEMIKGEE